GIQHGFISCQTLPGKPMPAGKVRWREVDSNLLAVSGRALQKLRQFSAVAPGSSDHIAPTSQFSVVQIVCSMRGIAALNAGDSARICVMARLAATRRSFSSRLSSE